MEPEARVLKGKFVEALVFSLVIVILDNVISLFLVMGSQQELEDSSLHPFLKEESQTLGKPCSSNDSEAKQASEEELIPRFPLSIMKNGLSIPLD